MGMADEYEEHPPPGHATGAENGGAEGDAAGDAEEEGDESMEQEEMKLYSEASAFQGAAVVSMIERHDEDLGEQQKILEITMEDGVTLSLALDSGERRLNELGYRQELKRTLHFVQLYSIGISFMAVFAGVLPMYMQGFANGGPGGLIWYWWITAFFVHLIALSMAEISSSFPTAGSLYFWAAALAGPKYGPLASFITGWMEFIGLAVGNAMVSYAGATILQLLILICTGGMNGGGHLLSKQELYAIASAVVIICFFINCCSVTVVSYLMVFSAAFQLLSCVALIITLPLVAPTHEPASWVFGEFWDAAPEYNPSAGYSFMLTLIVSMYSLYGYDGVAHMAEETKKSDRTAPMAIVSSLSTVTVLGWLLIVVVTYSIQNPDDLTSPDTVTGGLQPVVQVLWDAFYNRYGTGLGAQIFTGFIYTSFFFGTISGQLGASRVAYALARDNGLPFSFLWRKLSPQRVPIYGLLLSVIVGLVFLLPVLSTTYIFYAIASISSIGWVSAYAIPIFFRLIQKEEHFTPGPFYMANYIGVTGGKIVHFLSLVWILFTLAAFFLPTTFPITAENFNYAIVAIVVWMALFLLWWVIDARHWFKGPVRELDSSELPDGNAKAAEGKEN
eukprot:TRINITY_DN14228_c0_g1_i1.p1 TRINITY_DN14228_c0_g1~~TRINITY_DN14228_c0_g1_i1.p1  ORF type:complete len:617 (+),score=42.75 TRINITY_DN14228_c0_g1_i1:337-2187(+)